MSSQDPVFTRRTVLAGVAAGSATAGALGFAGALQWAGGPDPTPDPEAGSLGHDRPRERPYTPPDGSVRVLDARREFYSRPSASGGQTFGDLYLPDSANPALPVVVLVHGGGWSQGLGLNYMENLARDLASFDVAVWNVEYRRAGFGGGWPTTVADVCDAVDFLPTLSGRIGGRLDTTRVVTCGHSSGGHLALWLAARPRLPAHLPGAQPTQVVTGCVSLAGVADLLRADQTGDRYIRSFLGGAPTDIRDRYIDASPVSHLPTGIPVACLHGSDDRVVLPEQSEDYVRQARRAGDPARLEIHEGGRHDPWGDIKAPPWQKARGILLEMAGLPARPSSRAGAPTGSTPVPLSSGTPGTR